MYQDDWCFSENRYPLNLLVQQHFPGFINDENFDFHSPFATSIIIFTNQLITMTPAPFCHHAIPSYTHLDFCSKKISTWLLANSKYQCNISFPSNFEHFRKIITIFHKKTKVKPVPFEFFLSHVSALGPLSRNQCFHFNVGRH